MEVYQGYIENGKVVLLDNAALPDGHRVIITVLDDRVAQPTRAQEQLQAMTGFRQGMKETGPLPDEFDEIAEQRVNIAREEDYGTKFPVVTQNDRSHDDAMAEVFRKDPAYMVELLNSVLEDGEPGELLIALRQMSKTFGGIRGVAKQANLNPNQLYRTLSENGNPELKSLTAILRVMGLRLAVQPIAEGVGQADSPA
jgi:probable addiction module antidote protein